MALSRWLSEASTRGKPDALKAQVRPGAQHVEVGVVVQDADAMDVRRGSQDEVDRGQAVAPRSSQLTLGIDGAALDLVVDVQSRQSE